MRNWPTVAAAFLAVAVLGCSSSPPSPEVEPTTAESQLAGSAKPAQSHDHAVLFIGNSYTAYNNLPERFAEVAKQADVTVKVAMRTLGGATLSQHLANRETMDAILSGGWTVVVLQDQSMRPIRDPAGLASDAEALARMVRKAGARPILFSTWARAGADTQGAISAAYKEAGTKANAAVAPVGQAWARALATKKWTLHASDGSHPTSEGTTLTACVLFTTITGATGSGDLCDLAEASIRDLNGQTTPPNAL